MSITVKIFLTAGIVLLVTHPMSDDLRTRHSLLGFSILSFAGALISWIWSLP